MDEKDRIALLTYNTSVKQKFGLQEATKDNKTVFQEAINSITADGRTNLCDGLIKGKYPPGSMVLLVFEIICPVENDIAINSMK